MLYDLVVLGGGPGGCAAAITAARAGAKVLLLEAGRYPRHKVCGEFVSSESLCLLHDLLGEAASKRLLDSAPRITRNRLFLDGHEYHTRLSSAASIPRILLDETLFAAASSAGAECRIQTTARSLTLADETYRVECGADEFAGRLVVDASGRWSRLRQSAGPTTGRSPENSAPQLLGLKAHFAELAPASSTDLYFFRGGYCGVQPIGASSVNVAAVVNAGVATTLATLVDLHPQLAERSRQWQRLFPDISTSPLHFTSPEPVGEEAVLRVGDAAGFIDPFVGDGIAIALHSGHSAGLAVKATLARAATVDAGSNEALRMHAATNYAAEYRRRFSPSFRAAAFARGCFALDERWRRPLFAFADRVGAIDLVMKRTRVRT